MILMPWDQVILLYLLVHAWLTSMALHLRLSIMNRVLKTLSALVAVTFIRRAD